MLFHTKRKIFAKHEGLSKVKGQISSLEELTLALGMEASVSPAISSKTWLICSSISSSMSSLSMVLSMASPTISSIRPAFSISASGRVKPCTKELRQHQELQQKKLGAFFWQTRWQHTSKKGTKLRSTYKMHTIFAIEESFPVSSIHAADLGQTWVDAIAAWLRQAWCTHLRLCRSQHGQEAGQARNSGGINYGLMPADKGVCPAPDH